MVNLNGLNDAQLKAVTSTHDKILCLAGAGAGKTGTLTRRIAYLNDNRVSCNNMLALTFTRLAGKEMKERVIKLVGQREGKKLFANTYHAFCAKVLREHGSLLGYGKDFTIYDETDTLSIIKSIIEEFKYKTTVEKVLTFMALDPAKDIEGLNEFAKTENNDAARTIEEYQYRLDQNNAFDFDGLIDYTLTLFASHPEILKYYHELYDYVFLDEFQDTNDTQWQLIGMLDPKNIFVVGDDWQAIYGWRNANIDIILGLAEDPEWQVIKLEINYRLTHPIVDTATKLIKHNKQTNKTLNATRDGEPIYLFTPYDVEEESRKIAIEILGFGDPFKETAVLCRTNKQLEVLSDVLSRYDVPNVVISNKNDPLKKDDIKKLIGYLYLFINPMDNFTFRKIINFPRLTLTDLQLVELQYDATSYERSLYATLEKKRTEVDSSIVKMFELMHLKEFDGMVADEAFEGLVEMLDMKSYYQGIGLLNRITDIDMAFRQIWRWRQIQKDLGEGTTISCFLQWLRLKDIQEKLTEEVNAVKLLTIHAAKGLEFTNVFIAGACQDILPSKKGDIEEERRLMYVAATRAKERLYIFSSRTIKPWGRYSVNAKQSQFLGEMGIV